MPSNIRHCCEESHCRTGSAADSIREMLKSMMTTVFEPFSSFYADNYVFPGRVKLGKLHNDKVVSFVVTFGNKSRETDDKK